MSRILDLRNLYFEKDDVLVVEAIVEDAAVVRPATRHDPEEYGNALCRGSMYFSDEDLIPATDAELVAMLEEAIDTWEVIVLDD